MLCNKKTNCLVESMKDARCRHLDLSRLIEKMKKPSTKSCSPSNIRKMNFSENPEHTRRMALQFADEMLQPPVYPKFNGTGDDRRDCNRAQKLPAQAQNHSDRSPRYDRDGVRWGGTARRGSRKVPLLEAARKCIDECKPHFEPEKYYPAFYPDKKIPRTAAPDHILRSTEWLEMAERAGYTGDSASEADLEVYQTRRVLQWCLDLPREPVVEVMKRLFMPEPERALMEKLRLDGFEIDDSPVFDDDDPFGYEPGDEYRQ